MQTLNALHQCIHLFLYCSPLLLSDLNQTNHDTTRTTASITNTRTSNRLSLLLECIHQRDNDSCTRATKWMSQRDSTAKHVYLVIGKPKNLHIRDRNDRESFVDFKEIDVFKCEICRGECTRDGERRRGGEFRGLLGGICVSEDFSGHFKVRMGCQVGLRDEDDGTRTIWQGRRVWSCHGSVDFLESGFNCLELFFDQLSS